MAKNKKDVNLLGNAPLANVGLCLAAMEAAVNRPAHLPGIVTFTGPSGFGKSTAAAICAQRFNAVYVQARSSWTRKAALTAIIRETGAIPAKTIYDMTEQAAELLATSGRPLIVDECDYLVQSRTIELIRDIYEASNAAILLIGEETMPTRLRQWERFHGRVLNFALAEAASLADAKALAALYCRDVAVADDLVALIHQASKGSVRRICVNLERVRAEARDNGLKAMDKAAWGERELFTGNAPARRAA